MPAWSDSAFEALAEDVRRRLGLNRAAADQMLTESRLRRAMHRANVGDPCEFLRQVGERGGVSDLLMAEFTVGETYFFREPQHFALLRNVIVPEVVGRRGPAHRLRIWSAGCASGEEAYTLAIALEEAGVSADLLATDVSPLAIRAALEGTYRRWSLRALDATTIERWFTPASGRWRLAERVRQRVTFRVHNLAQDAYPPPHAAAGPFDVILCRNVLIYLDSAVVARAAAGFAASLAEGGWLVTGPSDPPLPSTAALAGTTTAAGIVYRAAAACAPAADDGGYARPPLPIAEDARRHPETRAASVPPHTRRTTPPAPPDPAGAFARGQYLRVLAMTGRADTSEDAALRVRALANSAGSGPALSEAERQLAAHPASVELHLLSGVLQLDLGALDDAAGTLRRALYLDPALAIAAFLLAAVLERCGDAREAARAYRQARDLARSRPAEEVLPLSDGERAGRLAELAEAELSRLQPGRTLA